ncbi:pseudaminic acid cytidylyltransferase [Cyclobacterium xiamenense]|uniref:pseudaminic acid cytidylyltransferase n=1 Tax=Cyclobacterium xiamenense TaxID=1297121 RepID=UPI0012B7B77B|nr:pseudaminic acid cytidylyltransferase [Cyclobacterium xiamenense]
MRNLCIIPARGGSKRIPRKNIKKFLGKPIIAYSIDAALKSRLFAEVMVSTDSEEIVGVANSFGATVPFMRSIKNADDYATTLDVVKEVLVAYRDMGKTFDNICILYPTAPFVTAARLKEGYNLLETNNASIPVTAFSFPVWRAFRIEAKRLAYQWPEHEKSRSQDLETLYHDSGQWYWIKRDFIKDTLVPGKTAAVFLDPMEVQDIDTLEDWELAELKFQKMVQNKKREHL